jgi:hypothetical protein
MAIDSSETARPENDELDPTVEECVQLTRALSLGELLDDERFRSALDLAQARADESCEGEELHPGPRAVLLRREFLKVLAGYTFAPEIDASLRDVPKERRTQMFSEIVALLRPPRDPECTVARAGFLDPALWRVERVAAVDDSERFLRLSLLVSAMLAQEDGAARSSVSLVKALGIARSEWESRLGGSK